MRWKEVSWYLVFFFLYRIEARNIMNSQNQPDIWFSFFRLCLRWLNNPPPCRGMGIIIVINTTYTRHPLSCSQHECGLWAPWGKPFKWIWDNEDKQVRFGPRYSIIFRRIAGQMEINWAYPVLGQWVDEVKNMEKPWAPRARSELCKVIITSRSIIQSLGASGQ